MTAVLRSYWLPLEPLSVWLLLALPRGGGIEHRGELERHANKLFLKIDLSALAGENFFAKGLPYSFFFTVFLYTTISLSLSHCHFCINRFIFYSSFLDVV